MRLIYSDWLVERLGDWQKRLAETYGQNDEYVLCLGEVLMTIDEAPTADVPDRKVGKWVQINGESWECSACHKEDCYAYRYNDYLSDRILQDYFCPNCGARMEGGE